MFEGNAENTKDEMTEKAPFNPCRENKTPAENTKSPCRLNRKSLQADLKVPSGSFPCDQCKMARLSQRYSFTCLQYRSSAIGSPLMPPAFLTDCRFLVCANPFHSASCHQTLRGAPSYDSQNLTAPLANIPQPSMTA